LRYSPGSASVSAFFLCGSATLVAGTYYSSANNLSSATPIKANENWRNNKTEEKTDVNFKEKEEIRNK
jgi:hypothetical protein